MTLFDVSKEPVLKISVAHPPYLFLQEGTVHRRCFQCAHNSNRRTDILNPEARYTTGELWVADVATKVEIWTIHPDGSGLKQFSYSTAPTVTNPIWSLDGTRLGCLDLIIQGELCYFPFGGLLIRSSCASARPRPSWQSRSGA